MMPSFVMWDILFWNLDWKSIRYFIINLLIQKSLKFAYLINCIFNNLIIFWIYFKYFQPHNHVLNKRLSYFLFKRLSIKSGNIRNQSQTASRIILILINRYHSWILLLITSMLDIIYYIWDLKNKIIKLASIKSI